jgi:hypothetical protein
LTLELDLGDLLGRKRRFGRSTGGLEEGGTPEGSGQPKNLIQAPTADSPPSGHLAQ